MDERLKKYGPEIILMFSLVILYYMKRSHQDFSDTNFMLYAGVLCAAYFYYKKQNSNVSFQLPSVMNPVPETTSSTISQLESGLKPFR